MKFKSAKNYHLVHIMQNTQSLEVRFRKAGITPQRR